MIIHVILLKFLVDVEPDFGSEFLVFLLGLPHDFVLFKRNCISGLPIFLPSFGVHALQRMGELFLVFRCLLREKPQVIGLGYFFPLDL